MLSGIGLGGPFAGLAVLAGNPGLMAGIFGYTGALKAKEMIEHASADVADFEFLSIENVASPDIGSPVDPLHTTICIAGFLRRPEDVANCFSVIPNVENAHALRYDPDALLAVGRIAQDTLSNSVRGIVQGEILKRTVFSTLMYSLWPLALLQTAAILDNPFSHALSISKKAGMHLAHTLMGRKQGPGPVSIIATSLGASVAFQCLKELDSQGAYGLVDTVVLLGSPVPTSKLDWIAARRAVAGRLINVYSTEDYLLAFLFRVVGLSLGCAGVHAVDVPGVENLDVTHIVGVWHGGYQDHLGIILRGLGFNVVDSEVERQEEVSEPPEFMSDSPMDLNLAPGARENQVVPAVVVSDAERKRQRRRGHGSDEENGDAQELRVWTRRKMD